MGGAGGGGGTEDNTFFHSMALIVDPVVGTFLGWALLYLSEFWSAYAAFLRGIRRGDGGVTNEPGCLGVCRMNQFVWA